MQSYRSLFSTIFFSCFLLILIVQGAKRDICPWIYCENNGTCIQGGNSTIGFECRCQFGFVGLLCENRVNITTCGTSSCQNGGTCTIAADRTIKCACPLKHTGSRCETKLN